jgi:MFS family permease
MSGRVIWMKNEYSGNIIKLYGYKLFINFFFFAGVLVPFFTDWGGITFSQIMILQTFFMFSVVLLEVPTGAIADYFGRKVSLIFASVMISLACLVYVSVPSFYVFLIGEFLWAAAYTLMSGADEALLYDSLIELNKEKESKKYLGRFSSFEMIGLMIAAPIGSLIAAHFGLRATVLFMMVPFFVALLFILSLKEPIVKKTAKKVSYFKTILLGIAYFKNHNIIRILAFDRVSIAVLAFMLVWIYQPILKNMGVPLLLFGFVCSALTFVQVIFLNNFTLLEKIFVSKKRYLLVSALFSGVGFIFLAFSRNIYFSIFLFLVIAGFGLTRAILFQNYINKYIESHQRATVISTVSMLNQLAQGVVYLSIGVLVKWSLTYALVIVGILMIICALISKVEEDHLID